MSLFPVAAASVLLLWTNVFSILINLIQYGTEFYKVAGLLGYVTHKNSVETMHVPVQIVEVGNLTFLTMFRVISHMCLIKVKN